MAESYYARRAALDPAWHEAQKAEAREGDRRRRKRGLKVHGLARREAVCRCRARQAAHGRTFHELLGSTGVSPFVLADVLGEEVALGRMEYHSTSRHYELNGALPEEVKQALRDLDLR